MHRMARRQFIAAAGAAAAIGLPRLSLAGLSRRPQRFVLVILRGALDGLALLPPHGDPNHERARAGIATPAPGADGGANDLDGFFALHPSCKAMYQRYKAGELLPLHALATPYRQRSHFDAQDVLELGFDAPGARPQGWMNRAIGHLTPASQRAPDAEFAVALAPSMPLILQGPHAVSTWSPSRLPEPDEDTLQRIIRLYGEDDFLGDRLTQAIKTVDMAGSTHQEPKQRGDLMALVPAAVQLLMHPSGPKIAVLESSGWDTHANQGTAKGSLAGKLGALDRALEALAEGLAPVWPQTVVLVVTEFGRTVAMNGTRGTDHGTGSAALLLGGGVAGGKVHTDWPGLATGELYEGRDLKPTLDLRSVFKTTLHRHMGVDESALVTVVFPDSEAAPLLDGIFRSAG